MVSVPVHPKSVHWGLGQGFVLDTHVLPLQFWQAFVYMKLALCTRDCHAGAGFVLLCSSGGKTAINATAYRDILYDCVLMTEYNSIETT